MDSDLQRVFSILISVIILFLFPIYITFEKKDDISYSLALKITYNFVENVRDKGYLSRAMYDKYVNQLAATNNEYDISIEHVRKEYDPIFYVYTDNSLTKVDKELDYLTYKDKYDSSAGTIKENGVTYNNVVLSYKENKIINTEKQIFDVIDRDNDTTFLKLSIADYKNINVNSIKLNPAKYEAKIYTMNTDDEFNVQIKNKNTTIATVFFNSFTIGANRGNNTRVYVNYGGVIRNETWKDIKKSNTESSDIPQSENSSIQGPYIDLNTNPVTSIKDGTTIYFKAHFFNPAILDYNAITKNFKGNVTTTPSTMSGSKEGDYIIKIDNANISPDQILSNAYISVNGAKTTTNIMNSDKFEIYTTRSVTVNVAGQGGSAYLASGGTYGVFAYDSSQSVSAIPSSGYAFKYWSNQYGETSNNQYLTFNVTRDVTWTAHFEAMGPRNLSAVMSNSALVISWDAPQTGTNSYNLSINGTNISGIKNTYYKYNVVNPGIYNISVSATLTDGKVSPSISGSWNVIKTINTTYLYNEYYYSHTITNEFSKSKKGNHTKSVNKYWYKTAADKSADNPYKTYYEYYDGSGTTSGKDSDRETDTYKEDISYSSSKNATSYSNYSETVEWNNTSSDQKYYITKCSSRWSKNGSSTDEVYEYTSSTPVKEYDKSGNYYERSLTCEEHSKSYVTWTAIKQ